jgi:hypothetical protein
MAMSIKLSPIATRAEGLNAVGVQQDEPSLLISFDDVTGKPRSAILG